MCDAATGKKVFVYNAEIITIQSTRLNDFTIRMEVLVMYAPGTEPRTNAEMRVPDED